MKNTLEWLDLDKILLSHNQRNISPIGAQYLYYISGTLSYLKTTWKREMLINQDFLNTTSFRKKNTILLQKIKADNAKI